MASSRSRSFSRPVIDPKLRLDPQKRIPRPLVDKLHRLTFEATGDAAIAVRHTEHFQPAHLGPLGFAFLTSFSLRSALEKMKRYSRLSAETFQLELVEEGAESMVYYHWVGPYSKMPFQYFGAMALLVRLCRLVVGMDWNPLRVEFLCDPHDDLEPFEKRFRCPVHFNCERNQFVVHRNDLDRTLPRAHPALSQVHDELVVRYLADLDRNDIVSRVRTSLIDLMPEGRAEADEVAERLNMSTRTLRRRLDDEGQSFRSILSDLRKERALRYIKDETLTLTEISYLLGFSEPSSFTRAFKGWTGESPTQARTH